MVKVPAPVPSRPGVSGKIRNETFRGGPAEEPEGGGALQCERLAVGRLEALVDALADVIQRAEEGHEPQWAHLVPMANIHEAHFCIS